MLSMVKVKQVTMILIRILIKTTVDYREIKRVDTNDGHIQKNKKNEIVRLACFNTANYYVFAGKIV